MVGFFSRLIFALWAEALMERIRPTQSYIACDRVTIHPDGLVEMNYATLAVVRPWQPRTRRDVAEQLYEMGAIPRSDEDIEIVLDTEESI